MSGGPVVRAVGILACIALLGTGGLANASAPASGAPSASGFATTTPSADTGLPAAATPAAGTYRAVFPTRLVDTRATSTRLQPGGRLVVPVLGRAGVPLTGVGAVQLNVTAVGAAGRSRLTVHPSGKAAPATSSLYYGRALPVANTVLARPGANGSVVVTNGSSSVDVMVDAVGWYAASPDTGTAGVHAIAPTRVLDSRTAGRAVSTTPSTVRVVGGPVPTGVTAVVANLTTVEASATGLPVQTWASGQPRPTTSNGNTVKGQAVATQVVVGVGTDGRIALATGRGRTHVLVDVVGYVVGTSSAGGYLRPVSPVRLVDTRTTGVPLASGRRLSQRVVGRGGVPGGASAALLTITSVAGPRATGTLVAVGNGERRPSTSHLNARSDVPVSRQVVVPLGVDGGIAVARAGGTGHVVIDLVGYVTAVPVPAVVPPDAGLLAGGVPAGPLAADGVAVLQTSVRHALGTWWPETAPDLLAQPMESPARSDPTDAVRRLSMEALSLSTALATGTYDPASAGATRGQARAVVETIVRTVSCRHRATVVGGWGHSWQSPLWSSLAARAGWLSWPSLSSSARACVRAMVLSEADFASTVEPYVMASRSGVVLRPGNSGAEENSWFALAPAVAVAMMPAAERREAWRSAEVRLLANSFSRADHLAGGGSVDGVPLADLLTGWNVQPDGSVINHARIAPDYSTNAYQNVDTVLVALLAGQRAPEASLLGLREVYSALVTNVYAVEDGFAAPGGAVYRPHDDRPAGAYGVYYPQGCDWGEGQVLPFALLDAQALAFGFGTDPAVLDPEDSAAHHLSLAVEMQERSADGRMYADPAEYNYVGREEHTAQLAAQLVLTLVLGAAAGGADVVEPVDPQVVTPQSELDTPPPVGDESRLVDPLVGRD